MRRFDLTEPPVRAESASQKKLNRGRSCDAAILFSSEAHRLSNHGSLAQWRRQKIARAPGITVEELVVMSPEGPRHWPVRNRDPKVIARNAIRRIRVGGEIEIVDGKVFPTNRMKVRARSD